MQPVPEEICGRFTTAFCYARRGYSLREEASLFEGYQVNIPALDSGSPPTKDSFFRECLYALSSENQRQFLYDLCDVPPPAICPLPSADERRQLLALLAQADGVSP